MTPEAFDAIPGMHSRSALIRYFNLYRLIIASLFVIFGASLRPTDQGVLAYVVTTVAYWFAALLFMLQSGRTRISISINTQLFWQVGFDIVVMTALMFIGGGQGTSIPYVLMTTLAGAALVGEGRMVIGFAAMATISVLVSELVGIALQGLDAERLARTGFTCMGYFAIALLARLLARRARENEALARQRGEDLARQIRLNAYVIEDMLDGVVVIDKDDCVLQSNPRATDLLGVALIAGEALGNRVPELHALINGNYPARLRAQRTGANMHVRCVMAGKQGDRLLYLEDMDRIEAQAKQLKLAALGRLTANIAHEIRNPLASVVQAAELLCDEKRAQMQLRLSQIVLDNANRIERIVRDVLEVGRRDRLTQESLDAGAFVRNFLDEYGLHTPLAKACVITDFRTPTSIRFDRVHLAQILGNLLGNALRYCSQQAGSVRIGLGKVSDGAVVISIRDDGPGVPEQDRERVFEPFHTTDPKGTGLGLYVARELADANGAQLLLADSANGAEFQLIARSGEQE